MAIMWVGGKPVEVSPEEALAFAKVADSSPPVPPETQTIRVHSIINTPVVSRLAYLYAALDKDGQEVLNKMLTAHPKQLIADDLKPGGDSRRLARVMSAITKRAGGKNKALKRTLAWVAGQRVIRYQLTDEMVRIAREEKWGDNR
jgi:hypothetical protein